MTFQALGGAQRPRDDGGGDPPIECPITASGWDAVERHSAVSASCRPTSTGWMRSMPTTFA